MHPVANFAPLQPPPELLADPQAIEQRVQELRSALTSHLDRLRKLDGYSRREKVNWFPNSQINVASVVRSTIRAAEKTAIAYLAGGTPSWRVASYGGAAGQAEQIEPAADRDARFERIARAIFHHIDRQSEINLLYEPVRRAVREGEIIMQYGWLPEHQRKIGAAPGAMDPSDMSPDAPPDLAIGKTKYRFPLMVRVLPRARVFYQLNPFGEPMEVYHAYTTRAGVLRAEYEEWDSESYNVNDTVRVIEAWVGGWRCVVVDGTAIQPPHRHHYGERPPFIIERCAPEEIESQRLGEYAAEVVAGMPFCMDMMEAFEQACVASSLKRVILENSAIGAYKLKNTSAGRPEAGGSDANSQYVLGPGTIFRLFGDEDLEPVEPPPLPPALGAFLEESERDMAELSFSSALLRGDAQGDPSGYSIEQIRQAAMARLMPYRDAIERAFSRLFERLFEVLALPGHWAPEWGESLTMAGSMGGEFFKETVQPGDLDPPPQHVEVVLAPAVPQNKIAERQAAIAEWQAGTADILTVMEERGIGDPQEELNSVIVHKFQLENPQGLAAAAMGILQEREQEAGRQLQAMQPVQAVAGQQGLPMPQGLFPPGAPGMGPGGPPGGPPPTSGPPAGQQPAPPGPGTPRPNQAPPGGPQRMPPGPPGASGPPPQQRPGMAPLGVAGAPNPPVPVETRRRPPGRR
jgi:hypothetical protein